MSGERKKLGWAFWVMAALLSLVLYVASIGPTFWLVLRTQNMVVLEIYHIVYFPIIAIARAHEPTDKIITQYGDWWLPSD